MNLGFALAAALSLITWAVHTFVGGKEIARPLLLAPLHPVPKFTQYYCWHGITLALLTMTAGFAYASLVPNGADVGVLLGALSFAMTGWSIALIATRFRRPLLLPQWIFFALITGTAAFGAVGV